MKKISILFLTVFIFFIVGCSDKKGNNNHDKSNLFEEIIAKNKGKRPDELDLINENLNDELKDRNSVTKNEIRDNKTSLKKYCKEALKDIISDTKELNYNYTIYKNRLGSYQVAGNINNLQTVKLKLSNEGYIKVKISKTEHRYIKLNNFLKYSNNELVSIYKEVCSDTN